MGIIKRASDIGAGADQVFLGIFAVCLAVLVLVTGVMVYFVIRYSHKNNPRPVDIEGNFWLETVWTLVPLAIFLAMFYFGWTNYAKMRNPPRDAMQIEVTARQWAWGFEYPNGKKTKELILALNRPVKLDLISQDVIHGFAIAAFRVKADVIPGRTNFTWFTPTAEGVYDLQCSVICGVSHSYMLAKVRVIPEEEFKKWYFSDQD
ncbi:MAG: cytochrome c oxidase subunit II [Elusimicrobiota bacterium]